MITADNLRLMGVSLVLMVLAPAPAQVTPAGLSRLVETARASGIPLAHGRRRGPFSGAVPSTDHSRAEDVCTIAARVDEMIVSIDEGVFESLPFRRTLASLHRPWLLVAGEGCEDLVVAAQEPARALGIVISAVNDNARNDILGPLIEETGVAPSLLSGAEALALLHAAALQFQPPAKASRDAGR